MSVAPDLHQEQRERLLEGLAASIREKGLAQTQVTDIVAHARASRRTFYKHFPDKDSALIALATEAGMRLLALIEEAMDPTLPLDEQADRALETYVRALTADRAMTVVFAHAMTGETVVQAQREGYERYAHMVMRVTDEAARHNPAIAPISFSRAYMAIAGMHEAIMRALALGEDIDELIVELQGFTRALAAAQQPAG